MIHEPPLLTIRRQFSRPTSAEVEAFRDVPTGHLVDAMRGRGCLPFDIKPLFPDRAHMVGIAVTCHNGPADNLALFGALDVVQAGDILVAGTDRFTGTAVTGDLLLGMARNKGAVGFVTDGLVRDIPGLRSVGLPVFCAGVIANSPTRSGPGTIGSPVVIGDQVISAGDLLVGDSDGVVVVPRLRIDEVLAKLIDIRAAEKAFESKVNEGLTLPDFMNDVLRSKTTFID